MTKNILPILTIASIILFGACSNEDTITEATLDESHTTISLIASMPLDDARTRVAFTEDETTKNIDLTWEAEDKLQFVFVQGSVKERTFVNIEETDISDNGKTAQFTVKLPAPSTGFDKDTNFDVYGVYGGGLLYKDDFTIANIIKDGCKAFTLDGIHDRGDMMLYFQSKDLRIVDNSEISVIFQHVGSLFSIKIKNMSEVPIEGIATFRLVGQSDNKAWVFNNRGYGEGSTFDVTKGLVSDAFVSPGGLKNVIFFEPEETINLLAGESITCWTWLPIVDGDWPPLRLILRATDNSTVGQTQNIKARTKPTEAGKRYSFYAIYEGDGINLKFADSDFNVVD